MLARECPESMADAGVSPEAIARAAGLLDSPGISVVSDAAIACAAAQVNSLHDPTEGGLATALQ